MHIESWRGLSVVHRSLPREAKKHSINAIIEEFLLNPIQFPCPTFHKKNCRSTYIVDFINLQWCTGVFDGFVCNMWKSLDGTPSAKKLSGRVIKLIYTFPAHSFNHSPPQFPSYLFVLSRDMRNSSHHPRLQWVLRQLSQNFALNFSFSKNKKVR